MSAERGSIFERRFPNELKRLTQVIDEAVGFLETRGIGSSAINLAHLAIEEMGTNILKYGYDDNCAHEILLLLRIESGMLLVVLVDDGHEFNPLEAPEPDLTLPVDQREPGGLGIHLVRKMAAKVEYQRHDGQNRLTIKIPV